MESRTIQPVIRELRTEEIFTILPLIELHNSKTPPETLRQHLESMLPLGYRCLAAYQDESMIGVAGFWLSTKFWCGPYLEADNVFVLPEFRSSTIGAQLMDKLEDIAKEHECECVLLDSYVTYAKAHKFYFRRGYEIVGFHFKKRINEL